MEFGVLGHLEVRRDGLDVPLGSFKQRSLLALLLIHANEVVSTDRIIDELWGDELVARPPERAVGARLEPALGARTATGRSAPRGRCCSPGHPATSSRSSRARSTPGGSSSW